MTTYFDETYAKVWADASVPCVYTAIERPLTADEFNLVARHQLSTVIQVNKSRSNTFSITDFASCRGLGKQDAIAYMTNIVEREFRLGVTHKFFIRSHDKITRDSFIHGLVAAATLNFYVCDSFADALKEINSIKENPLAVQPKKSALPLLIRLIRDIFSWWPHWKVTPAK
jgi:hypothetical protein